MMELDIPWNKVEGKVGCYYCIRNGNYYFCYYDYNKNVWVVSVTPIEQLN